MKHMLLNGLKSCTEEISAQSQEHLIITSENRPSTSKCSWAEPVNAWGVDSGNTILKSIFYLNTLGAIGGCETFSSLNAKIETLQMHTLEMHNISYHN